MQNCVRLDNTMEYYLVNIPRKNQAFVAFYMLQLALCCECRMLEESAFGSHSSLILAFTSIE